MLHLRVRRAAVELGVPLVDLARRSRTGSSRSTRPSSAPRRVAGRARSAPSARRRRSTRRPRRCARPGPVVVVLGRGVARRARPTRSSRAAARARRACPTCGSSRRCGAATCTARSSRSRARVPARARRRSTRAASGSPTRGARFPTTAGLDADGHPARPRPTARSEVLVLLGCRPARRLPRRRRSRARAFDGVDDDDRGRRASSSESTRRADVVLPCTLWGEKPARVTNLEGRVQRVGRKVAPEGTAMDDWRIAAELALRLGRRLRSRDRSTRSPTRSRGSRPRSRASTAELLRRARDGVVLPLREHRDEIVLRAARPRRSSPTTAREPRGTRSRSRASRRPTSDEPTGRRRASTATEAAGDRARARRCTCGTGDVAAPPERARPRDAYALRLVAGRTLYDDGRLVAETPSLAAARRASRALRVNPSDLARIGVDRGGQVQGHVDARARRSSRSRADAGVPAGHRAASTSPPTARRRRAHRRSRSRSPTCGWRRCGESRAARASTRCSTGHVVVVGARGRRSSRSSSRS